nr:immunoglobulin light chain junction region [Macaca mulatta]
WAIGHSSGYIF